MNKIETEIELSSIAKNKPLYFGLFMGAISMIALSATSTLPGMPMGLAILFFSTYFLNKNLKVFTFLEKHFVFQTGILGKKNIPYSTLKSYAVVKKNIVITYQNPNEKEKKIRLPVSQIEPTQFPLLEDTLKSKISV
ncbi:hypothetical protein [Formosa sp. PL04]|uniref:hypothetical protein n=1 Tax=Formosa sp. PL04 TaxID=3081755 RepID=UPI002981A202|nr:hypothetical protein [Formosa sp. PL04]MDW5289672.1 hypothetical protein [Formosa sp. PL04]